MRYVTFQAGKKTHAGLLRGSSVYNLTQAFFRQFKRPFSFPDLLAFLEADGPERIGKVDFDALANDPSVALDAGSVRIVAPLRRPPKIVCVGLNYRDHAAEQKKEPPTVPMLFAKASNVVIGDGDVIRIPRGISDKVDYEVELAVVIGKPGFQIRKADAASHVFGYTILNDVTARDLQQSDKQWFRAKSLATFAPMGPVVVTPDEINAADVALSLTVNGETRQNGRTRELIFDVPALIEFVSAAFPLETGDVISTGTPSGVGVFRTPPVFLKPGDRVAATIDGIGTLTNRVE